MDYSSTMVYMTLIQKIDSYQNTYNCKPARIKMSRKTNKKLTEEMDRVAGRNSTIKIEVIFGMKIIIDDNLYDNEIIILGKAKK